MLQEVRNALVNKLIESGEIKGRYLDFDSTNIPVKVKENNLKTSVRDRFKKNRNPKGDPESRLGVMIHFPKPFQKKIRYFWGTGILFSLMLCLNYRLWKKPDRLM